MAHGYPPSPPRKEYEEGFYFISLGAEREICYIKPGEDGQPFFKTYLSEEFTPLPSNIRITEVIDLGLYRGVLKKRQEFIESTLEEAAQTI